MSHDSASGYLQYQSTLRLVKWWSQDEPNGFKEQLDCGARALDLRVKLSTNGTVIFHHGPTNVSYPVAMGLDDIVTWLSAHPDELVVAMWDNNFTNATDASDGENPIERVFKSKGIRTFVDCDKVPNMTISEIKELTKLSSGGSLLNIHKCVVPNFDPSIVCYGSDLAKGKSDISASLPSQIDLSLTWACTSLKSQETPWKKYWTYVNKTLENPTNGTGDVPWMLQAHWQTSKASVVIGTLYEGSVLTMESGSEMNSVMTHAISSGDLRGKKLNFLEVDNVCDGGLKLAQALESNAALLDSQSQENL